MPETLQQFTFEAKEAGYLVAGLVLVLFVFFWVYLVGGNRHGR